MLLINRINSIFWLTNILISETKNNNASTSTVTSTISSCNSDFQTNSPIFAGKYSGISFSFNVSDLNKMIIYSGKLIYGIKFVLKNSTSKEFGDVSNSNSGTNLITTINLENKSIIALDVASEQLVDYLQFEIYNPTDNSSECFEMGGNTGTLHTSSSSIEIITISGSFGKISNVGSIPMILSFQYSYRTMCKTLY